MSEPFSLTAIQGDATAFIARLRWAESELPEESVGTDRSETVRVQVDRQGRPLGVTLDSRPSWDGLGSAVVEASAAAATARTRALEAIMAAVPDEIPPTPTLDEPTAPPVALLSLEELAEAAIGALHATVARATDPPAPQAVEGSAADGRVRVRMTAEQIVECDVDDAWARGRAPLVLAAALTEAITAAGRQLTSAEAARREDAARLDGLLAAALEHINNPGTEVHRSV